MATNNHSFLLEEETAGLAPVSPSSQIIHTNSLSFCIFGIAESEIPINVSKIIPELRTTLMNVNVGFSHMIVRDEKGQQWWKKYDVQVEDHVVVPVFPPNLTPEAYTKHFDQYLTKIFAERLPEDRPLWELHIINYPTKTGQGTFIFKMHHVLGDGFSVMGAIFSCFKRADNPSLPLTFPSCTTLSEGKKKNILVRGLDLMTGLCNTVADITSNMLHATFFEDHCSAVRSGTPMIEYVPADTVKITFSIDDIRQIKLRLGVSIMDVVLGIVFYGIHLYTQKMENGNLSEGRKTALVLLNTRMLDGYRTLEDMKSKKIWGNYFSFMHIPIPTSGQGEKVDPKKFIFEGKRIIKRNRNSVAVLVNGFVIKLMGSLRGTEAVSKHIYSVMNKTSITISNLIGPMEKMAIVDHPISNLYFTVSGVPQSILFPVISYMGKLTIGITVEKGFIDSQLIISCMDQAFKRLQEDD